MDEELNIDTVQAPCISKTDEAPAAKESECNGESHSNKSPCQLHVGMLYN